MLDALRDKGGLTLTELEQGLGMTRFGVMKHLKVLEAAGLVTKTRDAQRRPVHLEPAILDMMAGWIRRYQREAEARYQRLDDVLAQMNMANPEEDIA